MCVLIWKITWFNITPKLFCASVFPSYYLFRHNNTAISLQCEEDGKKSTHNKKRHENNFKKMLKNGIKIHILLHSTDCLLKDFTLNVDLKTVWASENEGKKSNVFVFILFVDIGWILGEEGMNGLWNEEVFYSLKSFDLMKQK